MIKLFLPSSTPATAVEFWEKNWGSQSPSELAPLPSDADNDRICETQPLWSVFERYRRADRLFFEGGCGPAHWVRYYAQRGQRVLGLDFAARTIERVVRTMPNAPVVVGDIHRIPLESGEAHLYYSGGVVEHIETGPLPALREARRVLASDGWFLCSVPDSSPLRRLLYPNRDGRLHATPLTDCSYAHLSKMTIDQHRELSFYQYVFSQHEFSTLLNQAGFEVVESIGMFFIHGLLEARPVQRPFHALLGATRGTTESSVADLDPIAPRSSDAAASGASLAQRIKQRLKDVVLAEKSANLLERSGIEWLRWLAPNMRLYIARPV